MHTPLLFLHIPKTAGTTLNVILSDNFDEDRILDVYTDEHSRQLSETTYDDMAGYDLVRGHIFIADYDAVFDGPVPMRLFTFLREPVERVISEYTFLKTWPKSHLYRYLNENRVSLTEYVTSDAPQLRRRGSNTMVNSLSGTVSDDLDERLAVAWNNLSSRFTCFGLQERFDESLLLLKQNLGLTQTFYERQNVQTVRAMKTITPGELDTIKEHNLYDMTLYDLASREFERRVSSQGAGFQAELAMFNKVNKRFQRVTDLISRRDKLHAGPLINGK